LNYKKSAVNNVHNFDFNKEGEIYFIARTEHTYRNRGNKL